MKMDEPNLKPDYDDDDDNSDSYCDCSDCERDNVQPMMMNVDNENGMPDVANNEETAEELVDDFDDPNYRMPTPPHVPSFWSDEEFDDLSDEEKEESRDEELNQQEIDADHVVLNQNNQEMNSMEPQTSTNQSVSSESSKMVSMNRFTTISLNCYYDGCAHECPDQASLVRHRWESHGQQRFVCLFCLNSASSYSNRPKLSQHLRQHHGEYFANNSFSCKHCHSSFRTYSRLGSHVHIFHRRGRFRCTLCGFISDSTRYVVNQHYRRHSRKKPHQNQPKESIESQAIASRDGLPDSSKTTSVSVNQIRIISLNCYHDGCTEEFTDQTGLARHLWESHGQKRFACLFCLTATESYNSPRELTRHYRKHHGEHYANSEFPCRICGLTLKSPQSLYFHIVYNHRRGRFACSLCDFETNSIRSRMRSHYHSQHGNAKSSKTDKSLDRIRQNSSPARIIIQGFRCFIGQCESAFKEQTGLEQHLLDRHGMRRIVCLLPGCTESFDDAIQLKCHLDNAHHIARAFNQYQCCRCADSFESYEQLGGHFHNMHRVGTFGCTECVFMTDSIEKARHHVESGHEESINSNSQASPSSTSMPLTIMSTSSSNEDDQSNQISVPNESIQPQTNDEIEEAQEEIVKAGLIVHGYRCLLEDCDAWFGAKDQYIDHLNRAHYIKRNVCWTRDCMRSFDSSDELNHHIGSDHKDDITCLMCDKSFSSYQNLSAHFTRWHERGHFGCSRCSFECRDGSRQVVIDHVRQHNKPAEIQPNKRKKTLKFWCKYPGCGYESRHAGNVTCHIRAIHLSLPLTLKEMHKFGIRPRRDLERKYFGK